MKKKVICYIDATSQKCNHGITICVCVVFFSPISVSVNFESNSDCKCSNGTKTIKPTFFAFKKIEIYISQIVALELGL